MQLILISVNNKTQCMAEKIVTLIIRAPGKKAGGSGPIDDG